MGVIIKIDVLKARQYADTLLNMSRSAFPVAIRSALNSTAFDVKKNTLQREADTAFINRSPNFFKANSRVEMATGFEVSKMQAKVGMIETSLKGGSNYSVKDLEQQQFGGTIKGKSLIPMNTARGGSNSKNVRPANRLSVIKRVVDARKAQGATDKQKFVKSVVFAGAGGYVLAERGGKSILWRVNSIVRTTGGMFKLTPLYSYEKSRTVDVPPTNFMGNAANTSHQKLPEFFIKEAEKQIAKAIKK
jgi:hypothetical protein